MHETLVDLQCTNCRYLDSVCVERVQLMSLANAGVSISDMDQNHLQKCCLFRVMMRQKELPSCQRAGRDEHAIDDQH